MHIVLALGLVLQVGLGGFGAKRVEAAAGGPVVLGKSPSSGSANVPLQSQLVLTFDENVAKGSGPASISIKRLRDNSVFETYTVATDSRVAINPSSHNVVTITPAGSFDAGTGYYVTIDSGALVNESNRAVFTGISDTTGWNFTTVAAPDTEPPILSDKMPADGGTGSIGTSLKMTFNEPVYAASGDITITNVNQPSDSQSIGAVSSAVTGSGTRTIVITPPNGLQGNSSYRITMPAGSFKDGAGNDFAGVASGDWSFTTLPPPLGKPALNPADNANGVSVSAKLVMTFPINISPGTGTILIKKIADNADADVLTVGTSDVSVSGNKVTLTPNGLLPNTGYYVLIDVGAFRSTDDPAALYEGITDATTWNFTTGAGSDTSPPAMMDRKPSDTQSADSLDLEMTFSEPVYPGLGNIVVKTVPNGSAAASIPVTSNKVSGGGTTTITVKDTGTKLAGNTKYEVTIGSQAFRDANGNNFPGTPDGQWTFTVTQDNTKPSILALTPQDDAQNTGISGVTLRMLFSEAVQIVNPAGVKVKPLTGTDKPALTATLSVDPNNDRQLLISVNGTLAAGTDYYVEMAYGTVSDVAGNKFDGILNQYQWTFKTAVSLPGAPVLTKAELLGSSKIALTYNELLDAGSVPANANFYATVNGASRAVTRVAVSGMMATLDLQSAVAAGQIVKLSYSPGDNPIKDITGTDAASFSNRDVRTIPTAPPPYKPPAA